MAEQISLEGLLATLVAETPDVREKAGEYARGGVVFAARVASNAVELRLGPEIADAALRTPHTSASPRGEEWLRLSTTDWAAASDRLEAWYRVAWRLAGRHQL